MKGVSKMSRMNNETIIEIANMLHEKLCHQNHCHWYYADWDNPTHIHEMYYAKANKLYEYYKGNDEKIDEFMIAFLSIFSRSV
jgi:hypothetical protein